MSDPYNCTIDLMKALDWQRSNAPIITQIIQNRQDWMQTNHCDFWNNWVVDVFNLATANDFGLAVWAIILDEPLYGVTSQSPITYDDWGFGEFRDNFNNGNFGSNADGGYNFTTEEKRIALQLKAFILHMSGNVSGEGLAINSSLARIFGANQIVCIDNRDMTFSYIFYNPDFAEFVLELANRDLLPRPAGIDIAFIFDGDSQGWGFGENNENFNNGNYYNGVIT